MEDSCPYFESGQCEGEDCDGCNPDEIDWDGP